MTPEQAFDDHHRAVYRFLYRLVGSEPLAEDITQECFLAILRHPDRWNPARGDFKTYLFSIARNLAHKHYRDHPDPDPLHDGLPVASISESCFNRELSVAVRQIVSQLPDLQREVLILFEYEGFRLHEIAGIVSADLGTVKARLHRAREGLKRALAPYRKVEAHRHAL